MLPLNLVIVRHGESEGNIANRRSRKGDNSDFTPEFLNRHSTKLRLTDKGKVQAKMAGDWLKSQGLDRFDGYYVSEYTRAVETAALLDLPDADWNMDFQLRERDHGQVDMLAVGEGRDTYFLYACEAIADQRQALMTFGLDLLDNTPEGCHLLDQMIKKRAPGFFLRHRNAFIHPKRDRMVPKPDKITEN